MSPDQKIYILTGDRILGKNYLNINKFKNAYNNLGSHAFMGNQIVLQLFLYNHNRNYTPLGIPYM